ncbi:hypothetical protein FEH54_24545, partial [Escherichia coli]|nr:hypothetical protein [Escherichia coli]
PLLSGLRTAVFFGSSPNWICPYISRHLLSLNPLQARCRRYSLRISSIKLSVALWITCRVY